MFIGALDFHWLRVYLSVFIILYTHACEILEIGSKYIEPSLHLLIGELTKP